MQDEKKESPEVLSEAPSANELEKAVKFPLTKKDCHNLTFILDKEGSFSLGKDVLTRDVIFGNKIFANDVPDERKATRASRFFPARSKSYLLYFKNRIGVAVTGMVKQDFSSENTFPLEISLPFLNQRARENLDNVSYWVRQGLLEYPEMDAFMKDEGLSFSSKYGYIIRGKVESSSNLQSGGKYAKKQIISAYLHFYGVYLNASGCRLLAKVKFVKCPGAPHASRVISYLSQVREKFYKDRDQKEMSEVEKYF